MKFISLIGLVSAITLICSPFALYDTTGNIEYAVYALAILISMATLSLCFMVYDVKNEIISKLGGVKNDDENNN